MRGGQGCDFRPKATGGVPAAVADRTPACVFTNSFPLHSELPHRPHEVDGGNSAGAWGKRACRAQRDISLDVRKWAGV